MFFTFQYVSINTNSDPEPVSDPKVFTFQYVSINTARSGSRYIELLRFTFQYVSINTVTVQMLMLRPPAALHSNMFLLILDSCRILRSKQNTFTFQYVSINTQPIHPRYFLQNQLYIPICFY